MKMPFPVRYVAILFIAAALYACNSHQKKSMRGDEEVTMQDFVDFFDDITLPYGFTDTIFTQPLSDSSRIDYAVFTRFLPDSMLTPLYKKEKPKIYALGKFRNGDAESYLLFKAKAGLQAVYIVAIDEALRPKASYLLMANRGKAAEINTVGIDKKYTITLVDEYKKSNGEAATYSTVLAYNTAGLFMVILNDGLKRGEVMELVNPIDTFPQTQPFAGDYGQAPLNFISIRDGETDKKMTFFLNMNKGKDCVAELKGEARWVKKDSAIFDSNLDGCKVGFRFSGKSIRITEIEGCGSRRPMECSFNATYYRKNTPKKSMDKKNKKK